MLGRKSEFEHIVEQYHKMLYKYAFTLSKSAQEASDLTQQTFFIWAQKGHQLRDRDKVKTWLFTTLHREYLSAQRRLKRFPHQNMDEVESELPTYTTSVDKELDSNTIQKAVMNLDDTYRAPVALFYFQQHTYQEITEILNLPMGTVKSRIARGKALIYKDLLGTESELQKLGGDE